MMKEIVPCATEEVYAGHIHIVHHCQREYDAACHVGYAADEHADRGDLMPGVDHDSSIAEVEEVVACEK